MTGTAELLKYHRQRGEEVRQQQVRQFTAALPVKAVFALAGVSVYAAFATFGMDWARLAGASGWEAAVWPIAAATTTAQALYCRVQLAPGWYPDWVRWLFDAVAVAGFALAMLGNGLHLDSRPHQLSRANSVLVNGVPGICLPLSVLMAAAFVLAVRVPEPDPVMPWQAPRSGATPAPSPQPDEPEPSVND